MPKGDLETLLKKTRRAETVPDFRKTWSRAEAMQSQEKKTALLWPRVLVPVGVTAVVAVLLAVGMQRDDPSPAGQRTATYQVNLGNRTDTLSHLGDWEQWRGELDGLGTEWTIELTVAKTSDDEFDTSIIAISKNVPGDDIYESQTDFLLDMDIPTWNQAVERNVL